MIRILLNLDHPVLTTLNGGGGIVNKQYLQNVLSQGH